MNVHGLAQQAVEKLLEAQENISDHESYRSPWWDPVCWIRGQTDAPADVLAEALAHAIDSHPEAPEFICDSCQNEQDPLQQIVPTLEKIRSWRSDPMGVALESLSGAKPLYGLTASGKARSAAKCRAHFIMAGMSAAKGGEVFGMGDRELGQHCNITHRAARDAKLALMDSGTVALVNRHVYLADKDPRNRVQDFTYNWKKAPLPVLEQLAPSFHFVADILRSLTDRKIRAAREGLVEDDLSAHMRGLVLEVSKGRGEERREGSSHSDDQRDGPPSCLKPIETGGIC